jgi:hypothetical protein
LGAEDRTAAGGSMSEQAIDVFFIVVVVVPAVMVLIWGLFMLVPVVIEAVAETISNIKIAVEKFKKAWRE